MTDVFEQNQAAPTNQPQEAVSPPWAEAGENKEVVSQPEIPAEEKKSQSSKPTEPPQVKEPIFKKIVPLIGFIILIVILFLLIFKVILPFFKKRQGEMGKGKEVTLVYWGLWEPESIMAPIIAEWQKQNPKITIQYIHQSYKDYRERLQSSLASGQGPDIFRFHNTWLPMLKKDLAPAPAETAKTIGIEQNYFPVVSQDLKVNSQLYGVPIGFDTLALFYNTDIFQTAGKQAPTSWEDLRRLAKELCVADTEDKKCQPGARISVAGVALGETGNVDHFSDILGLMMKQNSADLSQPEGPLAEDALRFFLLFTTVDGVWSKDLPASTYAFAQGKVAMIFAPSWRAHEIKNINPNLKFKTTVVPQLPETKVAWATYWAEGVSAKSKNINEAWAFLKYLSSKEVAAKLYQEETKIRKFGEPYARKDLAAQLEDDPLVGAFVKQGPYAESWYLCSRTFDNGINDLMIKYFEDAINTALQTRSVSDALATASQGVNQVLNRYGLK